MTPTDPDPDPGAVRVEFKPRLRDRWSEIATVGPREATALVKRLARGGQDGHYRIGGRTVLWFRGGGLLRASFRRLTTRSGSAGAVPLLEKAVATLGFARGPEARDF